MSLVKEITLNLPPNRFQKIKQALNFLYDEFIDLEIDIIEKDKKIKELEERLNEGSGN